MEENKNNKLLTILFIIFIVISIIHVLYASIVFRGMYCDGAFYMVKQLNWLADGSFQIAYDPEHPRFLSMFITQVPVIIAHSLLFIKNKFTLMFVYSFAQFAIPVVSLLWGYKLAKRTNKPDIFFWNLFTYGGIILTYQIFSVTESIPCISFHFILWNYLAAKMEYNKKDIFSIIFLLIMMFGTYEYVAYMGIFFFLCHFYYVLQDTSVKNQLIKTIIGFGSLGASIYTIWFMFREKGESGEIFRFIGEMINVIPQIPHLNLIITIVTIPLLIIFAFKKTNIKTLEILACSIVMYFAIRYLFNHLDISLVPMWEGHFRTFPCWWLMLVFLILHVKDIIKPKYITQRWQNLIAIALLCAVFQTFWQINNSYFWNKNVQYMKSELAKEKSPLYIADWHEEISSFTNEKLRRYIWHAFYVQMSILFSDTYEQKTLLVNYNKLQDENNKSFRQYLYLPKREPGKISLPVDNHIDIKNYYWDLTNCAKALDKHNKKYHIQTVE